MGFRVEDLRLLQASTLIFWLLGLCLASRLVVIVESYGMLVSLRVHALVD